MYTPTYDPINKIWSGEKKSPVYNADANLGYLILNVLQGTPKRIIQVCDDTGVEISCKEMFRRSLIFARFFENLGLKQNDVVGFVAENSENVVPVIIACLLLGLPINPVAPNIESNTMFVFTLTKPKVIFCDASIVERLKSAIDGWGLESEIISLMRRVENYQFVNDIVEEGGLIDENFTYPDLDVSSTPAFIMCSSGTTGRPKGISKSHKQIIVQLSPYFHRSTFSERIAYYTTGPFWITWLYHFMFQTLFAYKKIITSETVTPEIFMDIIERHKVDTTFCPPYVGMKLLKSSKCRPLPSVKIASFGGAIITESFLENIKKIFPNSRQICAYGSTEMDVTVLTLGKTKGCSSGQVMYNYQIKVVDESGEALGPMEHGELLVKPPIPFMNYYGEPEKYSETVSSDGWISSGDLGYYDEEGFFYIIDRIKNLLKRVINFSSREIEDVINEIPGVAQCCVTGVIGEDDGFDITYAFVIKNSDADELSEQDILNYVNEKVVELKRITGGVKFVQEFPLTASGKINIMEIKKLAKEIHVSKKT